MSPDEIASVVNGLADLLLVLHDAEPADKTEIYSRLGLRLTYQPDGPEPVVRTEVSIMSAGHHWSFERVRGPTQPIAPYRAINYSAEVTISEGSARGYSSRG
ncbi:MAG TPA: hypothetical protein VIY52_27140 [Streptosporangiaceae bacterium]